MQFRGAIFDVDGVVIDTAHIHHKSWQIVLKKYGIKFTYSDFKSKVDGLPRAKGAARILPNFSKKEIQHVFEEKQKYFIEFLKKERIKVFHSTVNLIKKLKKHGIKLAMASSSRNAANNLKKVGLFRHFDVDAEGAYVKRGKPYPDLFLKAAKKLRLKPEDCVVFEDAQIGLIAAIRAGMKCVGVKRDSKNRLKGADLIVKDLREVNFNKLEALFYKKGRYK
jgi:beta-phosphoglucomutase